MTATQAIIAGRREAEKLMATTVQVRYQDGQTMDPDTFEYVPNWVNVYEGKARIRQSSLSVNDAAIPGTVLAVQPLILSLPVVGSEAVLTAHKVLVSANPLDAALVGVEYTISGMSGETHSTARRFQIERIS